MIIPACLCFFYAVPCHATYRFMCKPETIITKVTKELKSLKVILTVRELYPVLGSTKDWP
jgi:hypothetical protein